jgi:hypothetical protein
VRIRLELPAFYSEVVRVLKPHGALAAWGYDLNKFDNPSADKVMEDYYEGVLGPYWDEGRRKVEQHYRGMAWSRSPRFMLLHFASSWLCIYIITDCGHSAYTLIYPTASVEEVANTVKSLQQKLDKDLKAFNVRGLRRNVIILLMASCGSCAPLTL